MERTLEPLGGGSGDEESGVSAYRYVDRRILATFEVIFCVAGVVGNLSVIVSILVDRKLRRSSKHFIIVSICLICLLQIGVMATGSTYTVITNQHAVDSTNCFTIVLQSLSFFHVSVVLLLACTLCINEYLDLLLPHTTGKKIRLCVAGELVLCSWFGSAIIIVPIVVYGKTDPGSCDFNLKGNYHALLGVLHYVPQAGLAFFLGTLLLLCAVVKRGRVALTENPNQFPIDIVVACLSGVVLNLPFSLFFTAFNHCSQGEGNCLATYRFWAVSSRLSFTTFALMPFVWYLGKDLRQSLYHLLCCCHRQPSVTRNHYVSVNNDIDLTL